MNKIYVYDCQKKIEQFGIENYFLCEINDSTQALQTALFLKCEYVRLVTSEKTIWINNGSLMAGPPDWYTPETVKNT